VMTLHLTGHPFIDISLEAIAAIAGKPRLADLTQEDLLSVAAQLKRWYSSNNAARNYISTVFTNSHFTQPSMSQQQREAYADRYLFAFLNDHPAEEGETRCVFFPHLAAVEAAYRQHIPLLNGENIGNFSPYGHDGLPVSGLALLAIHALPFGCLKCGGRLLGFHQQSSDINDPDADRLMSALVKSIWRRNLNMLAMPDESKWRDFGGRAKLRYVTEVIAARQAIEMRGGENELDYITGYYFTNYGTGAEMEIIRLDHTVMKFIDMALLEARDAWNRAVNSNWIAGKKGELEDSDEDRIASGRRNWLYEQLFSLPDYPFGFLAGLKKAPHWKLIEIFLKEVLLMEQKRIETYKKLGDLLTAYALKFENQPHSFYYAFSRARSYTALRGVIQTAAEKMFKVGTENTLFTYDDFIAAFEHPSERYSQWRLARDLISIRMLELLHQNKIDLSELPDEEMNLKALAEEEQS
jgi:CRISPR-associated protein Cst1